MTKKKFVTKKITTIFGAKSKLWGKTNWLTKKIEEKRIMTKHSVTIQFWRKKIVTINKSVKKSD